MPIIYDARGNEFAGQLDLIGGQTVTDARAATQSLGALNAESVVDLNGHSTIQVDLRTAAFNGTVVFEGTIDGTNYIALAALNTATQTYVVSVATATTLNTQVIVSVSAFRRFRTRVSVYTSGNVAVGTRASTADAIIQTERLGMTAGLSATAAVGVGVTLTIPSSAGLYHYIDQIRIEHFTSAAIAAAGAAPTIVTTTNIPGTPSYNFRNEVQAQGMLTEKTINFGAPARSIAAGTNTTVVCPATTGVIWRVTAAWRLGY